MYAAGVDYGFKLPKLNQRPTLKKVKSAHHLKKSSNRRQSRDSFNKTEHKEYSNHQ